MADYVSLELVKTMIEHGKQSCFMVDKHGFLPVHVACSRHCSPQKLEMLLKTNPASLFAKTYNGDTLLSLAMNTATKSHPNNALIYEIRKRMDLALPAATSTAATATANAVPTVVTSECHEDPLHSPDQSKLKQLPSSANALPLAWNCDNVDIQIEHRHLLVNL